MATALARLKSDWFVSSKDKSEDTPTRFHLKPLNKVAIMQLSPMMEFNDKDEACFSYKAIMFTLKLGIIGWENFFDDDGKVVEFVSNPVVNVERLSEDYIDELFLEILSMSRIGEDDKKK